MSKNNNYEIIIQSNRGWFYVDWQGLLHYRDLLFFLVRRDFISKYKQTILGPAWFIFPPLLMTVVFTVVFGKIAKIPTDGMPPILFYLCALLGWRYFASCLIATSNTFVVNAYLFGKVYFPRLIVPLSTIISNLLAFLLQLVMFLCFYFYFKCFTPVGINIKPNMLIIILPLLLLQTAALSLGFGLWVSALTAKYRDLSFLMEFLVQLWMFATPIIYPMSMVPEKLRFFININPMSPIAEAFRNAFFGTGTLNLNYILISVIITGVVLFSGILLFNKTERTFIDTV
jgi:lipopolysaccharide transport system permease protein